MYYLESVCFSAVVYDVNDHGLILSYVHHWPGELRVIPAAIETEISARIGHDHCENGRSERTHRAGPTILSAEEMKGVSRGEEPCHCDNDRSNYEKAPRGFQARISVD